MDEETGAAHAGDMELGSGIFYGYIVADVPLLMSNITGCDRNRWREEDSRDACTLLDLLIQAATQVTPGAKLGATAPYARAEFVMLEVGQAQPRSLANAFLDPVNLEACNGHPMEQSIAKMAKYLTALESMYGDTGEKRFTSSVYSWKRDEEQVTPLRNAVEGALKALFDGKGDQS